MPTSKELRDRHIRALVREELLLRKQAYEVVQLKEPIQRGWKRFHALTADALRRPDAERLAELLQRIHTTIVHRDRTFLRRKGRGRRKRMIEIQQPLEVIRVSLHGPRALPESWEKYFRIEARLNWRSRFDVWVFKYPYLFELRVEPNLYWYVRRPNPEVESRLCIIHQWMQQQHGYHRHDRLTGSSAKERYREDVRARIVHREMKRSIWKSMRGEVESRAFTRRLRLSRLHTALHSRSRSPRQRQPA